MYMYLCYIYIYIYIYLFICLTYEYLCRKLEHNIIAVYVVSISFCLHISISLYVLPYLYVFLVFKICTENAERVGSVLEIQI